MGAVLIYAGLLLLFAAARHLPAVTATTPLEFVPRAWAVHRTEGFVKMIASAIDERVLGVHMIGESAHEVIHVYPMMAEALKIGSLAFSRDVSKLSCCAE